MVFKTSKKRAAAFYIFTAGLKLKQLNCVVLSCLLLAGFLFFPNETARAKSKLSPNQKAGQNLNNLIPIMFLKGGVKNSSFMVDIENILYYIENQNLDIAITEIKIKDAKGNMVRSIAPFMPSVQGEYFYENYDGGQVFVDERPVAVKRTTHLPKATFSYDIPLGGRPIFQLQASRSEFHRAELRRDRVFQSSLFEGLKAYFNLLNDYSNLHVDEQSRQEASADLALTQRKFELGFVKKLDVLERKGIEADKRSQILNTKNKINLSKIRISTLLNVPLTWEIELKSKEIQPIDFLDSSKTLEDYLQTARAQRPDIKEMSREIKEAKLAYKMVRSDILPSMNLSTYVGGVGSVPGNLNKIKQYGGKMFVNVFKNLGLETLGNMKSAKARIQEAILTKQKNLNDIYQTISEDYYNTQTYREQMTVMSQKKEATQEAYRISRLRQRAGMGTLFEMTQLETRMIQAKTDYSSAVLNYNVSQSKLLLETGQLSTDRILDELNKNRTANQIPEPSKNDEKLTPKIAKATEIQEKVELPKEAQEEYYQELMMEPLEGE